jgi:hypothetical protein
VAPETDSEERTIVLAKPVQAALRAWEIAQACEKRDRGAAWTDTRLVFTRPNGAALHSAQVSGLFADLALSTLRENWFWP